MVAKDLLSAVEVEAEKSAAKKIGPEKTWFTEGEVSALAGVAREVLREMREELPAEEVHRDAGLVSWSSVAVEAHFGELVWVREGKPLVEVITVQRILKNDRVVLAVRDGGEVVRCRVRSGRLLRAGQRLEGRHVQDDLWEMQGRTAFPAKK